MPVGTVSPEATCSILPDLKTRTTLPEPGVAGKPGASLSSRTDHSANGIGYGVMGETERRDGLLNTVELGLLENIPLKVYRRRMG
jgi:hypothetical protein